MTDPSRRDLLATAVLALSAEAAGASAGAVEGRARSTPDRIAADLARYIAFGNKASGGVGDNDSGAWLEAELRQAGFTTERQPFAVPWFKGSRTELIVEDEVAPLAPHAIVVATASGGVCGPLVRVDPVTGRARPLAGAIALIDLPFGRWSSALAKPIREPIDAAFATGAQAAIVVTNGPTRQAIALNTDGHAPLFQGPVASLAPDRAAPFLRAAAAGKNASLHITGMGGYRDAFNLIGRLDRGRDRWVIVSTPRSGWFDCAGERGPGIAAWLALARWAPDALETYNLAFVCNSGHEYEYLGSERALQVAPPPSRTACWFHLGANVAARDWHEPGGGALLPLDSADPQRFLVASPALVASARNAFAGLPGLEMAYPSGQGAAGELTNILDAGYRCAAGIFGAHRFHHTQNDDARSVSAPLVGEVVAACQSLLGGI